MVDATKMSGSRLPIEIAWKDVTFEVPLSKTERKSLVKPDNRPPTHKTVLDRISGRLSAGSFTAIMGASGAGKTTLLNFLSNRKFYLKNVKHSGKVFLNGHSREEIDSNEYIAYVMQSDILIETMTVREILTFTAKLRLPPEKSSVRMQEVVNELELAKILDSRVGGILSRGISGGERKRVAIAMEILTDPIVLFLDEPTTGLDSHSAENVVAFCRRLCQSGKTVCCTIHQPNSYIFSLFQDLIVLADRKVVFSGDAKATVRYFAEVGFPFPAHSNPAEQIIDILSDSEKATQFPAVHSEELVVERDLPPVSATYRASFCEESMLLLHRSYRNYMRNRLLLRFKIVGKVVFLLIFLACYWQIASGHSMKTVTDSSGFLSFFITGTVFDGASSMGAYYDEKAQYVREQANRTYRPVTYYVCKMISELPFDLVLLTLYCVFVYLGIGLSFDYGYQIVVFVVISQLLLLCSKGWCHLLLFSIESIQAASAILPLPMVLQMLFGGFFINYNSVPKYLYEFMYLSVMKYAWSAAMIAQFAGWDVAKCGKGIPQCDPIRFYNIEMDLGKNLAVEIALTVAIHCAAFFALYRISKSFRS